MLIRKNDKVLSSVGHPQNGRLVRMARVYFGRRPHFGPYLRMGCPIRPGRTQRMAGHPQFGPRMGRSGSLSADRFLRPAGRNGAGHLRGTRGDADRQACPQRAGAGNRGRRPEHVPAGTDAGTVSYTRANAMRRWPTSRRTMPSPGTPATCRSAATSPSAVTS